MYHDHWSTADGRDQRAQGSELRMTAGAQGGCGMYSTTQQQAGVEGGRVDGNRCGNECVASRVGENNDADGRRRRSGQASGAGRKTGGREKRCVWEPGPSGRPVESCRRADVTPETCRGGRSRRRDLALGVSQYLVLLRVAWMTDDKQPAHNCERMNERTNDQARRPRRTVTEIVPRSV